MGLEFSKSAIGLVEYILPVCNLRNRFWNSGMEVVNECKAILSNQEVLTLLEEIEPVKKGSKIANNQQQNLATICYETVRYLEKTACKHQNPDVVKEFVRKVKSFKLTKAEKLQLLNHRPTTAVEIQLLIEESEERLTEEQTERLLEIIAETLPPISGEVCESMEVS